MGKTKKTSKIILAISVLVMLLSGIVASVVQTSAGHTQFKELTIETDDGYTMSAYLLIPSNATAENPAPAVVTSHGYLNNKEMTDANYVELARRGFVVLAIDQPNHGDSEVTDDFDIMGPDGVYQGVLYLKDLSFVDSSKIGITGHSMGAWSCNAAVKADNEAETQYISSVLLHCNDPEVTDDDGNYINIYGNRDVGVISAVYDEFFGQSTAEDGSTLYSPYFMESDTAQSFLNFSTDPSTGETREAGTYYAENIDGVDATRVIYRSNVTHPWSHFSKRSETYVIEYFTETLGAPNAIDSSNQTWQIKEAANFIGMLALIMFIISFAALLLFTPTFEKLRAAETVKPAVISDGKGKAWFWGCLLACAAFGTATYLPIMGYGAARNVSQCMPMGIGLWSAACGLFAVLTMVVYYFGYGKKHGTDLTALGIKMPLKKLGLAVLMACIVIIVSYSCTFVIDYFFHTDFRIWTIAIKAFEAPALKYWPYILLFVVFYVASSVAVNCFNYNNIGGKFNGLICALFTCSPAFILMIAQYGKYFSTNEMMWPQVAVAPNPPMNIVSLFQIGPILFVTTLVGRAIYKKCGNPYIGGIINGVIIGLMTIVNTCTTVVS